MKYQLVFQEHHDSFGNWLVRNERGDYAAAPSGVSGAKPRRWLLSEDAVRYMEQRASVDARFVWLYVPTVCQGKPGATSIRHCQAAAHKPVHGGYPTYVVGTVTSRSNSSTPNMEEIARAFASQDDGSNEEASTVPQQVITKAEIACVRYGRGNASAAETLITSLLLNPRFLML